jgi:hypothetical protein
MIIYLLINTLIYTQISKTKLTSTIIQVIFIILGKESITLNPRLFKPHTSNLTPGM